MIFTHDTEVSLIEAAALVNTVDSDGVDELAEPSGLQAYLARNPYTGVILGTDAGAGRGARRALPSCAACGRSPTGTLRCRSSTRSWPTADARPFLTRHDEWDWHLHVTPPDAPLAQRMAAEAAMAFLELVRADDWARLQDLRAPSDCNDVLVDLSKNRSKRYCADGNCGNRAAVAAYRARKRAR